MLNVAALSPVAASVSSGSAGMALFYAYLRQGAQLMNICTDVPAEVIGIVTGIIILLVSSSFAMPARAWLARLFRRPPAAQATGAGK